MICKQFPQQIVLQNLGDILLSDSNVRNLGIMFKEIKKTFPFMVLYFSLKIQRGYSINYFDFKMGLYKSRL